MLASCRLFVINNIVMFLFKKKCFVNSTVNSTTFLISDNNIFFFNLIIRNVNMEMTNMTTYFRIIFTLKPFKSSFCYRFGLHGNLMWLYKTHAFVEIKPGDYSLDHFIVIKVAFQEFISIQRREPILKLSSILRRLAVVYNNDR